MEDVLRHVNLSRRSLDYRFVKAIGHTVHDAIVRARMERLADLLIRTDWTLAHSAERLAFPHSEYMSVAFKRFAGVSPGSYRRANRLPSSG